MSDLKPTGETLLDAWLLEERAPRPAPDLVVSVMAAVREEARHAAPRKAAVPAVVPPPLFSGGALWRPALAMAGALALAVLALILWSGTAGGERGLPLLVAAVESPVFPWLAGTLLACAAAIAVPMAWMEA
jgi:hypothetical protein